MPIAPLRSALTLVRVRPASVSGTNGFSTEGASASTWAPPPNIAPIILPTASPWASVSPDFCAASICLPAASMLAPSAASLPSGLSVSMLTLSDELLPIALAPLSAAPVPAMPPTTSAMIQPRMIARITVTAV